MRKRMWLVGLLVAVAVTLPVKVSGQNDPRQILRSVIQQAQTGRLNQSWYGFQLWQLIAYQTNGSGVYPQLVQLGAVRNVTVNTQLPLPTGVVYAMTAQHARGRSYWELGVSSITNRIEYASFITGPDSEPFDLPAADEPDEDVRPPVPTPKPTPKPGGTSEACRKFPNLC